TCRAAFEQGKSPDRRLTLCHYAIWTTGSQADYLPGRRLGEIEREGRSALIENSQLVILAALGGAYPDYVSPGSQRRAHDLMRSGPIAEGDDGRAVDRHALPGNIRGEQVKVNVSTTGAFFQLPIQGDKDDLAIRHRDFVEVLNEHDIAGG